MAYSKSRSPEASQPTNPETRDRSHSIALVRTWLKSILLSGMLGISACATTASAVAVKPAVDAGSPVVDGQKRKIEKGQPNLQVNPNPKLNPKPKPKPEKNRSAPVVNPTDPTDPNEDSCMDLDYDQPGACEIT